MHQKLILAPRMIQSMEILQMPVMALQERIQQELEENPVLEIKDKGADASPSTEELEPGGEWKEERSLNEMPDLDFDRLESMSRDWEDHLNEEHRPSRNGLDEAGDKKHDAMQNMAARPQSLIEYLLDQVVYSGESRKEELLARHIISNLDENGFLSVPMEDVLRSFGEPVTSEEAEDALLLVQKLDPPGVGARDLKECLLLQLTPDLPNLELLRGLILNHMDDIRNNRLPLIQKKTSATLNEIKEAIEKLKTLNPRPAAAFQAEPTAYVVPDIVIEKNEDGSWKVRLVDDYIPEIYISRRYIEMLRNRNGDPKAREYLARKIQSAKWLKESIEQRRRTLEKVTRAIIEHQAEFLENGPESIVPLKMQQIADQVGVHVTTVSRAVDDKWVQTPRGVFSLRRFFGGGTTTATGEEVAWETIKQKLLEIIGQEDKANPLSDEDLVKKLEENGCPIARRTITKYRKLLNIPSSRQRKDWTKISPSSATEHVSVEEPVANEEH
jgi:RNA polymerase sigma-54 factor